jgi:hypothetical protein
LARRSGLCAPLGFPDQVARRLGVVPDFLDYLRLFASHSRLAERRRRYDLRRAAVGAKRVFRLHVGAGQYVRSAFGEARSLVLLGGTMNWKKPLVRPNLRYYQNRVAETWPEAEARYKRDVSEWKDSILMRHFTLLRGNAKKRRLIRAFHGIRAIDLAPEDFK